MLEKDDKERRSLSLSCEGEKDLSESKRANWQSVDKMGSRKPAQLEEQVLLERVLERLQLGDAEWKSTLF